jgi:5-(carboxyamino)imidazole ribonucleotide mutase
MDSAAPTVGIIMGSQSDWKTMKLAADMLTELGVSFETRIVSAHRTPQRLYDYAMSAKSRGLQVIIAGAGGAAHLPGMAAAMTPLPVLGVPIESRALKGMDSLLSIVQMPGGVPVGTLAIGDAGAKNAGIMAASIIALQDKVVAAKLDAFRKKQTASVAQEPVDEVATEPKKTIDPASIDIEAIKVNVMKSIMSSLAPELK